MDLTFDSFCALKRNNILFETTILEPDYLSPNPRSYHLQAMWPETNNKHFCASNPCVQNANVPATTS